VKVVDLAKLAFVTRNERESERNGMSSDKHIVAAHRLSFLLETGTEHTILAVGGFFEGQNVHGAEHGLDLSRKARRSLLGGDLTQLRGDDDAGRHLRFTDVANAVGHAALRIAD
jgi:hypothetical protein